MPIDNMPKRIRVLRVRCGYSIRRGSRSRKGMEQMGEALRQTQGDGDVRSRDDSTHEGISVSRTIARLMMLVNAAACNLNGETFR